eukprot:gene11835-11979_t
MTAANGIATELTDGSTRLQHQGPKATVHLDLPREEIAQQQKCHPQVLASITFNGNELEAAAAPEPQKQGAITQHPPLEPVQKFSVADIVLQLKATGAAAQALFWDVLLPTNSVMLVWDLTDLSNGWAQVDLVISILFLIDCWQNFRTAYVGDNGRLVTSRQMITRTYLRGWFCLDLLTSIPYDQLLAHSAANNWPSLVSTLKVTRAVRIVRFLRLLKLLRVARMMRLPFTIGRLERKIGTQTLRMVTMALGMMLMLHWTACIWYYVAAMYQGQDTWIAIQNLEDADHVHKYITALYWSTTTMCTVGYGDVYGTTIREKIVAMMSMLLGASTFGYFMGTVSIMVSAMNRTHARQVSKHQAVEDFLRHRKVPGALAEKVRSYYNYVVAREVQSEEAAIIAGLSSSLRMQVVLHLYQEAVEKVPFFSGRNPHFITSVVTYLRLEYYSPGDIVVRQGDYGDRMYFLGEGMLEVRVYEDDRGRPLTKPAFIRSPAVRRKHSHITQSLAGTCAPDQSPTVSGCAPGLRRCAQRLIKACGGAGARGMQGNDRLSGVEGSRPHQGAAQACVVYNSEDGRGGVVLPDEYSLPLCSAQAPPQKWTYEDELGDRPYR